MKMASRNEVHLTNLATLIVLIQTQVCFFCADDVEINLGKTKSNLDESDFKMVCEYLCNSSNTCNNLKHDSGDLNLTVTDQPGQDHSSYRSFMCGYSRTNTAGWIKCNRTNSSFKNRTGKIADMHVNCNEGCVDIWWVNISGLSMSPTLQGDCVDSTNKRTSTTATTGAFDSTTTPQPESDTSVTQSSTSTTAASSLLPVSTGPAIRYPSSDRSLTQSSTATIVSVSPATALTTCTQIAIIAITVSICTVLIILGLVIIVFLRKRKKGKLEQKHATHSLENSNNTCLPDAHVGDGNPTHSQGNAELQLHPRHPNTGASCTASAATSNVGGDNDVAAGYASVGECNLTDVYARLREQPSRTPDTYDTLGNVVKVVDDKTRNTTINSGLLTGNQQGANVIDHSTYFELSSANNDSTSSVHKSKSPSSEHRVYTQVVKKPERKSKKMESATVISDNDYNSNNKSAASASADVESRLRQEDSTISDVYNIMP